MRFFELTFFIGLSVNEVLENFTKNSLKEIDLNKNTTNSNKLMAYNVFKNNPVNKAPFDDNSFEKGIIHKIFDRSRNSIEMTNNRPINTDGIPNLDHLKTIIIIDSGYTSNKLNIFHFSNKKLIDSSTKFYPSLLNKKIEEITELLEKILKDAKEKVQNVQETNLAFVGTEGLRTLLSHNIEKMPKWSVINSHINRLFARSGFITSKPIIISGVNEGLYAYESLIYLKYLQQAEKDSDSEEIHLLENQRNNIFYENENNRNLQSNKTLKDQNTFIHKIPEQISPFSDIRSSYLQPSTGIIEMGGGSLQVTFSIIINNNPFVIAKSFNEMGMKKGREIFLKNFGIEKLIRGEEHANLIISKEITKGSDISANVTCTDFNESCISEFKSIFGLTLFTMTAPIYLVNNLYLLSFYYDVLNKYSGIKWISDIVNIFEQKCLKDNDTNEKLDDHCIDLSYIIFTLKGLGVSEFTHLQVSQTIGGFNLTWGVAKAWEIYNSEEK